MKVKKKDIDSIEEIKIIVDDFYNTIQQDEILGKMFVHINWEQHLPIMYSFWNNVLFHTGGYSGNPMEKHQAVHQQFPLTHEHFKHWLDIFKSTIKKHNVGANSMTLMERAKSIATIMEIKILS